MSLRSPTATRTVVYFFLITLVVSFCSLFSPLTFGSIRDIPQSPSWSNPAIIGEAPSTVKIPSLALDSEKTAYIVYYGKVNDLEDIFCATVHNQTVKNVQNLTNYPSLKESVSVHTDSKDNVYVGFLDNRKGKWQVFLLNATENNLMQLTDTDNHKEDVSFTIGCNDEIIVTWTDFKGGTPRILLTIVDSQGNTILDQTCISGDNPSTKASASADGEKIHVMYLEKQVYDHIIYNQVNYSGESLEKYDLGECIHRDAVALGVFKGPQFVVADTLTCVWSDFSTGSHSLYYIEFTEAGDILNSGQLTDYPLGMWSWMPSIVHHAGSTHILYVNNGYGHRIFHSSITDNTYEELGTVTERRERGTAPFLLSDGEGMHCVYLQFKEGRNFNLVYRNTYPSEATEASVSERMEESSLRYVYSFALSFLFAFPMAFWNNFIGIVLLLVGFFVVRHFNVKSSVGKIKGSEYVFLGGCIAVLAFLGSSDYSYIVPIAYEVPFIVYGFVLSFAASFLFKYLLGDRFDFGIRILLSCLVFLYLFTLVHLLPAIQHL